MRLSFKLLCIPLLALASCCTKKECDLVYAPTSFAGFTPEEVDTVRIIIRDMEQSYSPDTLYSEAVYYPAGADKASLTATIAFNKRNSYEFYLPATGMSYLVNGYEFSQESCNSCFPSTPSSEYHDVLRAYKVNGVKVDGQFFVIQK